MVREAFRPGDVAMSYHNDPAYRVDAPCDVGPIGLWVQLTPQQQADALAYTGPDAMCDPDMVAPKRHHPDGIAPVAERDQRAQRRAAERDLMEQYRNPADYAAACRVLHGKPIEGDITPHVEAGETFARLIRGS